MTLTEPGTLKASTPPCLPVRRFTVDEYHRLGEVGILSASDRVELLDGWIVEKVIHNPRHGATIDKARDTISDSLPRGWRVRVQLPVTAEASEPEPDLAIVRGPAERYSARHPSAEDTALVVEVSDSSLERDRDYKVGLYARTGFCAYWIINLADEIVEAHGRPHGVPGNARFTAKDQYGLGDTVPLTIEEQEVARIPVRDLIASPPAADRE